MPRTSPIVLIFEQHSFSSGSETAEKLVSENWCNMVGFEVPRTWGKVELRKHYENKKNATGFTDEAMALKEFTKVMRLPDSDERDHHILFVRSYFSASARLKLLGATEKYEVRAQGLDLTLEEKKRISGHIVLDSNQAIMLKAMLEIKDRNNCIIDSIASVDNKSMVCILGIQHAHEITRILRSKGILYIPCFIRDTWFSKEMERAIDATYSPAIRKGDGLLEFSSVDVAMDRLREILLPYSIGESKRLDSPTSLTSQLIRSTHLPFFSIQNETFRVSAITEIAKAEDEKKAKSLQSKLNHGSFFTSDGKRYFGLPAINLPETSSLPEKILKLCL